MGTLPEYYTEQTMNGRIKARIKIEGIEDLTLKKVMKEVEKGKKFIIFRLSVFLIFYFYQHSSSIYFTGKNQQNSLYRTRLFFIGLCAALIVGVAAFFIFGVNTFSLLDFSKDFTMNAVILMFLGLGAFFPISSLVINIRGGEDITPQILRYLELYENHKKGGPSCPAPGL
ncbi:MAG: hypothetical protein JW904_08990 [Spirochaetales bacterium]|nr:hypothetical protein [Spirochaetales bacterium]